MCMVLGLVPNLKNFVSRVTTKKLLVEWNTVEVVRDNDPRHPELTKADKSVSLSTPEPLTG